MTIKRIFDFILANIGMVISLPVWVIIGLLIWLEDGMPIFYLQQRVGLNGKIFTSIKFRSMIPDAEKGIGPMQAKENDPRITYVGRFLRKTAMDELPQLLNIFKGDMSFVGPRALRPIEVELNSVSKQIAISQIPGFKRRISIKPGLTGFAQVFASRSLAREEKFKYDLWYIDNRSFWLDVKLIAMSFLITFKRKWDI